ncbi:hypothetical protein PF003_g19703 [Phytophthora fragariae]|nr:hypothetical protein PF003_g19703 [Phytophthora fragariae]
MARNSVQSASSPASMIPAAAVEEEDRSTMEAARSASVAAVLLETATTLRGGGDEATCQRAARNREDRRSEATEIRGRSGGDGVRHREDPCFQQAIVGITVTCVSWSCSQSAPVRLPRFDSRLVPCDTDLGFEDASALAKLSSDMQSSK